MGKTKPVPRTCALGCTMQRLPQPLQALTTDSWSFLGATICPSQPIRSAETCRNHFPESVVALDWHSYYITSGQTALHMTAPSVLLVSGPNKGGGEES